MGRKHGSYRCEMSLCSAAERASRTLIGVMLSGSRFSEQLTLRVVGAVNYLVDPASSHMLVSKIKPCMSKYKHLYCETANGSLNQLSFI